MNTRDTHKLASSQYATADNLHARWGLLEYARPRVDIHRVGIDRLGLAGGEEILEVGCGDGSVLVGLRRGGHAGRLVGLEIAEGMFADSVEAMERDSLLPIEFLTGSADRLPHPDKSFDVVLAFFMLYHMPDIQKTLSEWKRVLKDGGRLLVATGSRFNKPKQKAFKKLAESLIGKTAPPQFSSSFNMENAEEQLAGTFAITDRYLYTGAIELQTADPYLRAFRSTRNLYEPSPSDEEWTAVEAAVYAEIENEIARNGTFTDRVERGFFVCENR